jgi:hypothetical protein
MLVFTVKVGEAIILGNHILVAAAAATAPNRHHYRCWLCKCESVLEFEPDASESSWTECHHCGLDNEIPPGVYDRSAIIPGQVPCLI